MTRGLTISLASALIALFPHGLRAETKPSAVDTTAFTTDLYAQLARHKGNLFLSPASIETALAMSYAGANGATAAQMARTLHFNGTADQINAAFATLLKTLKNPPEFITSSGHTRKPVKQPAYQLIVANALWPQQGYPLRAAFADLVQKDYLAGLHSVDYRQTERARTTINDWVARQTKDKIKDLIAKGVLTPLTRLVITNAVYFKSNWAEKFQKSATRDGPFKLSTDKSVAVSLMHQRNNFGYMENDYLQLLELPYEHGELVMVILLPRQVDGLADLEKRFTAGNLRQWLNEARSDSVDVTLPKFTFSAQFELADTLKAMGMTDAFDPRAADFSGMTRAEPLFISDLIHKAFVAVDEDGTEAAAATAEVMAGAAQRRQEPKVFNADHPFIFLICHNATGEILFAGRLANPKNR